MTVDGGRLRQVPPRQVAGLVRKRSWRFVFFQHASLAMLTRTRDLVLASRRSSAHPSAQVHCATMVPSTFLVDSFSGATAPLLVLADSAPDFMRAIGRMHPVGVHFPIALALVAAGIECWRTVSRREGLSPLTLPLLCIAAVSSVMVASSGWINAAHEYSGEDSSTLALHRWLGISTAIALCLLAWWCRVLTARTQLTVAKSIAAIGAFRVASIVVGAAVAATGHFGGDLVHGEGYLLECLFPSTSAAKSDDASVDDSAVVAVELTDNDRAFIEQVYPILQANCFECHGAKKQKGGLRLDSNAWLFNGDEADWAVIPNNSADSELFHRISLDRTDPDAMPPEGDALTAQDREIIREWIDNGAAYPNMRPGVAGARGIPSAAATAAAIASGAIAVGEATNVDIDPAVRSKAESATKQLLARGVLVQPVAMESPLLDVNASRAEPALGDGDAQLLADIAPIVANLNLSKTAITDAGLAMIGAMPHLEKLRLDSTAVTDEGLNSLGTLARVQSINLVASKVTSASIAWMQAQPMLTRVYVWQTALDNAEDIAGIAKSGKITAVGGDFPLAQPTTPPMPLDAKIDAPPSDATSPAPAKPEPAQPDPATTEPAQSDPKPTT